MAQRASLSSSKKKNKRESKRHDVTTTSHIQQSQSQSEIQSSLELPFLSESVGKPLLESRKSKYELYPGSTRDSIEEEDQVRHVGAPNGISLSKKGIKSITRNDFEMRVGRKRRRRRRPRSLGMLSTLADGKWDLFSEQQRFDPHHGPDQQDQMTSGQSPLSNPASLSSSSSSSSSQDDSDSHPPPPPPQQSPNDGEPYTLSYDNGRDEEIHQLLKEWEESVLQHQSSPQIHQEHIPTLNNGQYEQELPHILHHLHHQLGSNDGKEQDGEGGSAHQTGEKTSKEWSVMESEKNPDRGAKGSDDAWRMPADDPHAHPYDDGAKEGASHISISKEMPDPIINAPSTLQQQEEKSGRRHVQQQSESGRRYAPGHFGSVRLTPELIEKLYQYYKEIQSRSGNSGAPGSGNSHAPLALGSNVQTSGAFTKRGEGPQLSIVNPLDVLRQRLLLEMARRRLKENQHQIQANERFLESLG